jgi:hypothetical protein
LQFQNAQALASMMDTADDSVTESIIERVKQVADKAFDPAVFAV